MWLHVCIITDVYIYCICNISQDITTRQHDRQTLHVGNPLPAFGGNGRSTAQEYLITPRTWQHGFSWKWDWPKKVADQDESKLFCIWHIVTKNIELDYQQWEVYGGYSIQLYTLDFRLKTQNNVPELAGLVHNKTYKPLVSHIMDQVIWPPALPKAPFVDTTKENHHFQ